KDEELLQPQLTRTLLDFLQQRFAVTFALKIGMNGERRELAHALVGECIERRAADDVVVVFGDDEALDLALQPLARPAHEDALLLQRLDNRNDAADVVDRRIANVRERGRRQHRSNTVAREELEQQ